MASTSRPDKGFQFHPADVLSTKTEGSSEFDWTDKSSYDYIPLKAGFAHWAWEFLRRNYHFQQYCDQSPKGKNPAFKGPFYVNRHWGLSRFKHYAECYDGGRNPNPSWCVYEPFEIFQYISRKGSIRKSKDGILAEEHSLPDKKIPHMLAFGQIAVVFDLNEIMLVPKAIEAQIDAVRTSLVDGLDQFQRLTTAPESPKGAGRASLLRYLRIVDAYSSAPKIDRLEIAKILCPELFRGGDEIIKHRIQNKFHSTIHSAKALVYERGYLALLGKDLSRRSKMFNAKNTGTPKK